MDISKLYIYTYLCIYIYTYIHTIQYDTIRYDTIQYMEPYIYVTFQHPWIVATPSQILDKTHHSESFIPWGTECTPQGYQFNVENNDKPLAVGIQLLGKITCQSGNQHCPTSGSPGISLTHPRLGNQPLTLHGSADLANVSPILKGTPASITWGFVLGFVCRFRGIRHSIQWSKTSKVLSPPAYHAPQVTTLPSCRGQGVLSIIYLLWW